MPRAIRAAVSNGGGVAPIIETLFLDDPAPDEVVIQIMAAGICHTDLNAGQWIKEPRVLGHEAAGIVVETGSAVTAFSKGDRVITTFGSCGSCPNCLNNRPAYCFDGVTLNFDGNRSSVQRSTFTRSNGTEVRGAFFQQSSFATYALATERNIVRIPEGLDMETAAPFGCSIQTGAGAVFNQLRAKKDQPLLVVGAGPVGLAAIMAARIIQCSPIICVELNEARRELALSLGATHAIDGVDTDWVDQVQAITRGGSTAALDTAGTQATFEGSIAALHSGGTLGLLTLPGDYDAPVQHPGGLDFLTKTIVGVVEGDSVPQTFLRLLISYHEAGDLPVEKLIQTYPFEKVGEACADVARGHAIKAVLTFEEEH